MVGPDRVVQDQRVVALAPAVPDPLALLEDQGVDAHQSEVGRHSQAALARSEDDDLGLAIGVPPALSPHVGPVLLLAGPGDVTRSAGRLGRGPARGP